MLVRDKDITSEGNLGGTKIAMTLDEKGLSHIMSLLTNLYSDPALAAIRETCTNAIDSHIAAKQTRPIEVSTPNRMFPYFVVQDFGVGMSVDDVVNIVSKYGASTKNQSDDYNGMMGIGLKSPLAYTDQFTIVGIKDGKKASILVTRSKSGASDMEIVDVRDTAEANGVLIRIPVNDRFNDFTDKVNRFAKFVEDGKILVNGVKPPKVLTEIGPNIFIEKPTYWGDRQDRIVMGNVAYPINAGALMNNHSVIFYVPMGAVSFTPSREDLEYTKETKKTVDECRNVFYEHFSKWLSAQTEKEASYADAYVRNFQIRHEHTVVKPLTWRGEELPDRRVIMRQSYWNSDLNNKQISIDTNTSYIDNPSNYKDKFGIENFNCQRFTRVQARKIQKFFADKNIDIKNSVFFIDEHVDRRLIPDMDIYDWTEIRKIKVAQIPSTKKVQKGASLWEGLEANSNKVVWFEPDKKKEIVYSGRKKLNGSRVFHDIAQDGKQFCFVTDGQIEKFLKQYPNAITVKSWYLKKVKDYIANITNHDLKEMSYNIYNPNLARIEETDIKDPDLQKIIKSMKNNNSKQEEYDKHRRYYYELDWDDQKNMTFPKNDTHSAGEDTINKYPLLSAHAFVYGIDKEKSKKHLVLYLNSAYEAMQNGAI